VTEHPLVPTTRVVVVVLDALVVVVVPEPAVVVVVVLVVVVATCPTANVIEADARGWVKSVASWDTWTTQGWVSSHVITSVPVPFRVLTW